MGQVCSVWRPVHCFRRRTPCDAVRGVLRRMLSTTAIARGRCISWSAAELAVTTRHAYSEIEMKARLLAATLVLGAVLATPMSASADVELRISSGRVWLRATNATVAQILAEWSRLGQTRIVNGDRVPGGPVTLQLDNVSEEEALDVLLRSAAGFMGVRRTIPLAASSEFDRILILPKGTAPTAPVPDPRPVEAPAAVFDAPQTQPIFMPGVQRVIGPDGQPVPDDQENESGGRGAPVVPGGPQPANAPAG